MEVWQYPNCNVSYPHWVGDGSCDDSSGYNVPECGMDGGDCAELNAFREKYPNCNVSNPYWVGDGDCDDTRSGYNVPECGIDGGDCVELNAFREKYPTCDDAYYYKVGDGHCDNLSGYNTPACGFDGGDCEGFNAMKQKYPDCPFEEYAYLSMGNGVCDFIVFDYIVSLDPFFSSHRVFINTSECGYDDGDCDGFSNLSEEDDTSPSIFFQSSATSSNPKFNTVLVHTVVSWLVLAWMS